MNGHCQGDPEETQTALNWEGEGSQYCVVSGERWVIFSTIQWEFLMEQIAIKMQNMGSNYVTTIFLLSLSLKANCLGSFYTHLDFITEHSSTMEKVFNGGTCSFFLLLRLSNVYTSWWNIRVRTSQ